MKISTKFLCISVMASVAMTVSAESFTTSGDGTNYTMQVLSETTGSGVTLESDGIYVLDGDITIAAGDSFTLDNGVTIKMGDNALLTIEGTGNFDCTTLTTITRNTETDEPKGVYINTELTDVTYKFTNVRLEYAGLRSFMTASMEIKDCQFVYNNGNSSSSGAIAINLSDGKYIISNCDFIENEVPAIGTGANVSAALTIENCLFRDNNTENRNKPQVNLTAGGDHDIIIKNSTFEGAQRDKVGGISVSNMMSITGTNNVVIEGNEITEHRYGITTLGELNVRIVNNRMVNNNHETNPMNGGSGISIYDTNYTQNVYIEGNYIENSLWGITIIGGKNVNVGKTEVDESAEDYNPGRNVFVNNGNGGQLYDLYNNGTNTVYAQGNTWNVTNQTAEEIETVITHKADNDALGEVIYMDESNSIENNLVDAIVFNSASKQLCGLNGCSAVSVYSLDGSLVALINVEEGVADLNTLEQGVYIVRIDNASSVKVII